MPILSWLQRTFGSYWSCSFRCSRWNLVTRDLPLDGMRDHLFLQNEPNRTLFENLSIIEKNFEYHLYCMKITDFWTHKCSYWCWSWSVLTLFPLSWECSKSVRKRSCLSELKFSKLSAETGRNNTFCVLWQYSTIKTDCIKIKTFYLWLDVVI